MRKVIAVILCFVIILAPVTAYANSAQMVWAGRDVHGVTTTDENCPLVVENEILTLDIPQLPDEYSSVDELKEYQSCVTARYTFKNPADYDVDATLVFPFETLPNYINIYDSEKMNSSERNIFPDGEKYSTTLDGENIDREVRFTFSPGEFNVKTEMAKIHDGYIEDDFLKPDTVVTKYVYKAYGWNTEEEKYADVGFIWENKNDETAVLFRYYNSFKRVSDKSAIVTVSARENEEFEVYFIGKPPQSTPELKCWKGNISQGFEEMEGTVEAVDMQTMNFEEFVLSEWDRWKEERGISKVDWYNIFVTIFNRYGMDEMMLIDSFSNFENMQDSVIGWFKYDISVPAGQTVVNTVTAPLYPGRNYKYEPPVFDYKYYLSPAGTWADFGSIEIKVKTPYYITESSIDGFEKTENGYIFTSDSLPKGELELKISSGEHPVKNKNDYAGYMLMLVGIPLLAVVVIAVLVIMMIKKAVKSK